MRLKRFSMIGPCAFVALGLMTGAASAASSRVASDVDFTEFHLNGDPDRLFVGEITSDSPKCVKKRRVTLVDAASNSISVKTGSDGQFVFGTEAFQDLPAGPPLVATAGKVAFGKKNRKVVCKTSASATFTDSANEVTITNFAFDDPTNTFTATLTSPDPFCVANRSIPLFRSDDVTSDEVASAVADAGGTLSVTLPGEPQSGSYEFFRTGEQLVELSDGNIHNHVCGDADGPNIVIG
jgi:hypothetical protein